MSNCLDSSNECAKEDNIIVEDSDDSDDQDLVDPTHVTEAHLNPGVVIDKLITVIVAFFSSLESCITFLIVQSLCCSDSSSTAAFNWSKLWDYKFKAVRYIYRKEFQAAVLVYRLIVIHTRSILFAQHVKCYMTRRYKHLYQGLAPLPNLLNAPLSNFPITLNIAFGYLAIPFF